MYEKKVYIFVFIFFTKPIKDPDPHHCVLGSDSDPAQSCLRRQQTCSSGTVGLSLFSDRESR